MKLGKPRIAEAGLLVFALAIAASSSLGSGRAQTAAVGKELFDKRCGGCHALDSDKEGPRLRGVYGRAAGTLNSFQYSGALKNSKLTWNGETLDRWLANTENLIPDNDMAFRVENAEERRSIIAYLKQNSVK